MLIIYKFQDVHQRFVQLTRCSIRAYRKKLSEWGFLKTGQDFASSESAHEAYQSRSLRISSSSGKPPHHCSAPTSYPLSTSLRASAQQNRDFLGQRPAVVTSKWAANTEYATRESRQNGDEHDARDILPSGASKSATLHGPPQFSFARAEGYAPRPLYGSMRNVEEPDARHILSSSASKSAALPSPPEFSLADDFFSWLLSRAKNDECYTNLVKIYEQFCYTKLQHGPKDHTLAKPRRKIPESRFSSDTNKHRRIQVPSPTLSLSSSDKPSILSFIDTLPAAVAPIGHIAQYTPDNSSSGGNAIWGALC